MKRSKHSSSLIIADYSLGKEAYKAFRFRDYGILQARIGSTLGILFPCLWHTSVSDRKHITHSVSVVIAYFKSRIGSTFSILIP